MPSGPTHWTNRSGSVCARSTCAGVALKSRVMRMTGTLGSASMVASAITFMVLLLLLVAVHGLEYSVEAPVALLSLPPVALDPGVHQVEDLRLQVHGSRLRSTRTADHPGVLEHSQVLVDRLQRHRVPRGELVDRRVGGGQAVHHVAAGRVRQCGEDPRESVGRHRCLSVTTLWLKPKVDPRKPLCQPIGLKSPEPRIRRQVMRQPCPPRTG